MSSGGLGRRAIGSARSLCSLSSLCAQSANRIHLQKVQIVKNGFPRSTRSRQRAEASHRANAPTRRRSALSSTSTRCREEPSV